MTSIEMYADVHERRMQRFKRRQLRREQEQRRQEAIGKVRRVAEIVLAGLLVYGVLFVGSLWASM